MSAKPSGSIKPIQPIRTDADLRRALKRLEGVFQANEGSLAADERDVLVTLIEVYENKHHAISPADPVEAIKFRMEQQGLTPRDLEPFLGPSGRVSEVLNRKRPLSLRMVKQLHDGLQIPYESLLAGVA
jgi:HTH-type transcriptional regulator / antitoxin HigA